MLKKTWGIWTIEELDRFYAHIKGSDSIFWVRYCEAERHGGEEGIIELEFVNYIASAGMRFYPGRAVSGQQAWLVRSVRVRARRELGIVEACDLGDR